MSGSNDLVNSVEFSPDSSLVAVSIGRAGNGGTNGQVFLIKVADGQKLGSGMNPNGEDRFYDSAFSPDGELIALQETAISTSSTSPQGRPFTR